jgi:hypothetical protein
MPSKLIYEVCGSAGTYKAQDGSEKTRWIKAGVVFQNDKGYVSMKLDAIPTRRNENGELWLSLFVPQDKKPAEKPAGGFREPAGGPDGVGADKVEDIPW